MGSKRRSHFSVSFGARVCMPIKDIYQDHKMSRGVFYGCMVSVSVQLRKCRQGGWSKKALLRKPSVHVRVFHTDGCLFSLLSTQEISCCLLELVLEVGSHQRQPKSWVFPWGLLWQPHSSTPTQED